MSERALEELIEYAGDARWDELARGAEFTLIDRGMLGELHIRARIAAAVVSERKRLEPQP